MYRALRTLALTGLLAFVVFVALVFDFAAGAFPPFNLLFELVRDLFRTTGFALTFTSGIVAVVVCLQRRQYRWAAGLIVLLVLATYGLYLADLLQRGGVWLHVHVGYSPFLTLLQDPSVAQYAPAVLLALFVLVYSFRPPPVSGTAASTSTSSHTRGP